MIRTAPIITGLPSGGDQANLLSHVQQLFEELKNLLQDETKATELSVLTDVEKIVKRAEDHLKLVEELALMSKNITI